MSCNGECKLPRDIGKPKSKAVKKHENSDGDDVWASDEDIPIHADLQRAHVTQGYLDGLVQAQEKGLQEGFDSGYPDGAELGIRVGRILAILHGTPDFITAKSELNIVKVLDKRWFDENLNKIKCDLVERWEHHISSD